MEPTITVVFIVYNMTCSALLDGGHLINLGGVCIDGDTVVDPVEHIC